MNVNQVKAFLKDNDFHPSKKLGQNFLVNNKIIKEIIEKLQLLPNEWILEIGPGLGALTFHLNQLSKQLILVELDKRLYELIKQKYNNQYVLNNDILLVNLNDLQKELKFNNLKVVANIPYSISSKIILYLMAYPFINEINLLVQTEMAQHLFAKVNQNNYNSFSILVQLYFQVKIIKKVTKDFFIPKPNVDSSFIQMKRIRAINQDFDYIKMSNLLKISFGCRRKTLFNNLIKNFERSNVENCIKECGFKPNVRPQELTPDDFCLLYQKIY